MSGEVEKRTAVMLGAVSQTLRNHLVNMLGIISENKELMRIQRGSADDRLIQAARRCVIETRDGVMDVGVEDEKLGLGEGR